MCEAINSGSCADNLLKKNSGKMVHSRWLTTANRILRSFVFSLEPAENLLILVNFTLRVYAPMWIATKTKLLCIYGAKHLHQTDKLSRYVKGNWSEVIVNEAPLTKFLKQTDVAPCVWQGNLERERCIKIITESAAALPKEEKDSFFSSSRQGYILTSLCQQLTRRKNIHSCDTTILIPFLFFIHICFIVFNYLCLLPNDVLQRQ
nr:unnamed protein product [Callosobruchus analis]